METVLEPVLVAVNGIITQSLVTKRFLWIKTKDGIKGIIDGDGREVRKINGRWIYEAR